MVTHSTFLAWRIPWSLVGSSPRGLQESDRTKRLTPYQGSCRHPMWFEGVKKVIPWVSSRILKFPFIITAGKGCVIVLQEASLNANDILEQGACCYSSKPQAKWEHLRINRTVVEVRLGQVTGRKGRGCGRAPGHRDLQGGVQPGKARAKPSKRWGQGSPLLSGSKVWVLGTSASIKFK